MESAAAAAGVVPSPVAVGHEPSKAGREPHDAAAGRIAPEAGRHKGRNALVAPAGA